MKRFIIVIYILVLATLTACTSSNPPAAQVAEVAPSLLVSGEDISRAYTRADLEALPASQAVFKGVTFKGVTVSTLIQDAGFDLGQVKALKAVASDGFTVNFEASQVFVEDVIVAYARADGDLVEEDGAFRMVLPNAEGRLNVRRLAELQVIK